MKTYLIDSKKGTMKLVPNAKKSGSPSRTRSASVENDSKSSKHRINPRSSDEELPAAREPSPSPHVKTPKDYTTLGQVFGKSSEHLVVILADLLKIPPAEQRQHRLTTLMRLMTAPLLATTTKTPSSLLRRSISGMLKVSQ